MPWDQSGNGSGPHVLVAGGDFAEAGNVLSRGVAIWNGAQWVPLSAGLDQSQSVSILSLGVYNGDLYAGGYLAVQGTRGIARWSGSEWVPVGPGLSGGSFPPRVRAMAVYNDRLYVGGWFTHLGGVPAGSIASWDGAAWSAATPGTTQEINALTVLDGVLYAGGEFSSIGGVAASRVARFDGTVWAPLGAGANDSVLSLGVYDDELVAGGRFTTMGGVAATRVARWRAEAWEPIGSGLRLAASGLWTHEGELHAVGSRASGSLGTDGHYLMKFDGTNWVQVGDAQLSWGTTQAVAAFNGNIYVGGPFNGGAAYLPMHMAVLRHGAWMPVASAFNGNPHSLAVFGGELFAAGGFTAANMQGARWLARLGPDGWESAGFTPRDTVGALHATPEVLYWGGQVIENSVRRVYVQGWDGTEVYPVGNDLGGAVSSNESLTGLQSAGGELYLIGNYYVPNSGPRFRRLTGGVWTPVADETPSTLYEYGGNLLVGGLFATMGGTSANNVALHSGNTWAPLGAGVNPAVRGFGEYGGSLFASTSASEPDRLMRWDGATWHPTGVNITGHSWYAPHISAMAVFDGDLVVGGYFVSAAGFTANSVARWDGTNWSPMGAGVEGEGSFTRVQSLAAVGNSLFAAGSLTRVAGRPSPGIARWTNGSPTVLVRPHPVPWVAGSDVELSGAGYLEGATIFRWRRNGGELLDGPTPHGSLIGGSSTRTLVIQNVGPEDAGLYELIAENACGSGISNAAQAVVIAPPCYANCDGSTVEPVLNVDDFTCFINEFAAAQVLPHAQQVPHYANCDGSTVAPVLNVDDFTCFIIAFSQGCP
jgi:trimeric autotransporter adhesin